MSPVTKRSEAKEGGFAQVREALLAFEGDVINLRKLGEEVGNQDTGFAQWGGQLIGDDGKPRPPREFLQVSCSNVKVLEVSEPLSMELDGGVFTFRVNCSDFKDSFWIEDFLGSADNNKILLPEGLSGKRVTFKKITREAKNQKTGVVTPKYNTTNFIIDKVVGTVTGTPVQLASAPQPVISDPLEVALELAIGKTEAQFRSAVALHPAFANSPLLSLAKTGAVTASLVKEGKLKEVKQGNQIIYQKP